MLLQNEGFDALPGPKYPIAGKFLNIQEPTQKQRVFLKLGQTDYDYFDGGYTVRAYGSHSASDKIDAIQMETPSEVNQYL